MSVRDERDFLLRMIAMAAATVARLRGRLTGGDGGSAAEVVQSARAAQAELLGRDGALLQKLDPASAAQMLGPERILAWADLLQLEADALRAAGKADEARAVEIRALALVSLIKR
jgi:hypothetical protein